MHVICTDYMGLAGLCCLAEREIRTLVLTTHCTRYTVKLDPCILETTLGLKCNFSEPVINHHCVNVFYNVFKTLGTKHNTRHY